MPKLLLGWNPAVGCLIAESDSMSKGTVQVLLHFLQVVGRQTIALTGRLLFVPKSEHLSDSVETSVSMKTTQQMCSKCKISSTITIRDHPYNGKVPVDRATHPGSSSCAGL